MRSLMGIINLGEPTNSIRELTQHRTLGAVPFGSRYRLIDFTLSNMVNAGIRNVGILMWDRYGPLLDHIKSGKEWDLDRQRDGLFLLPPANSGNGTSELKGDVVNLYGNMAYLQKSRQKYVVISGSSMICNMDYGEVLDYHLAKGADVTIVYSDTMGLAQNPPFTSLVTDDDYRVLDLAINPQKGKGEKASMNMYIMEKNTLIELVDHCASRGKRDMLTEGLLPRLKEWKVYGYPYIGYVGEVNSLKNYYKHSMELLNPAVWQELFFKKGLIHTKIKHEPPVRYLPSSSVRNSLIANGCIIEGTVENSILFRGVRVNKGAVIQDSIVMQKAQIGEGVLLKHVILDKDVKVSAGKRLTGDGRYPIVIHKLAEI